MSMNFSKINTELTAEVYELLLEAVETGKWSNGIKLTEAQVSSSMQLIMLYQAKKGKQNEHLSIQENGEIKHKSRAELKAEFEDIIQTKKI